ncbi:MAG TPA: NUDIX hydrolase [Acidimicrobiales bacterium]|jgi:ADP-ribose pyrophosphatase|nr:NUDIX hydrolase [Acidimicrobiales bacterium]
MTPSADRPPFQKVGGQKVFESRVFSVETVQLTDPDGEAFERDLVRHPGAVAVIPLHDDGTVSLVRQFRASVMTTLLEAPAGTRDVDGEPPEETARRELIEEAGLDAGTLRRLVAVRNSPGFCDQETIVYLATDLSPVPTARSGIEEQWMSVERVPLAEVDALVADGRLVDETTVLGLLLARTAG